MLRGADRRFAAQTSDAVDVVLEVFYPGACGDDANMNILYITSAVVGKLPYTGYDASLLAARPSIMDMWRESFLSVPSCEGNYAA